MTAYADHDFYLTEYHGSSVSAEEFPRLAVIASRFIDHATKGRARKASGDTLEYVKMAMCELCEAFRDEAAVNKTTLSGDKVVASETVGSWSKSYYTGSAWESVELLEGRKRDILALWLGNTGLLSAIAHYAPPRELGR